MENRVGFFIEIYKDLHQQLKTESDRQGVPMCKFVEIAIKELLKSCTMTS